jgi:hypothetical protein
MSEFIEERTRVIRSMASTADPFTKLRLMALADKYERHSGNRRGRFARCKHRRDFLLWALRRANGEGRGLVKFNNTRPFADPEAAARKLIEMPTALSPTWTAACWSSGSTGRFFTSIRARPAEYGAGIKRVIENGWLVIHESGPFLRFTRRESVRLTGTRPPEGLLCSLPHAPRRQIYQAPSSAAWTLAVFTL